MFFENRIPINLLDPTQQSKVPNPKVKRVKRWNVSNVSQLFEGLRKLPVDRRNVTTMYNVLKTINQILLNEIKVGDHRSNTSIELIIYDYFLKQFGLKTIAEKKLIQFINSLKAHSKVARINLFGRFVNLYNEQNPLEAYDFFFYLKCI